jgi:Sulfotransferase family
MYQMLTLEGAAQFYDAVMDVAELARPLLGLRWHEVRYEHLMADFPGQMGSVCRFLGIEWIEGMQTFASRVQSRERATPSTAQLARGLDRSGIGVWQHYRAVLESVQPVLARWVERPGAPLAH